jgi:hypothetical protein
MKQSNQQLGMHKSASYRIQIQGELDEDWSYCLGGMTVHIVASQEKGVVTVLVGYLLDQAALAGVLNTLYSLQMPLISVEYIAPES